MDLVLEAKEMLDSFIAVGAREFDAVRTTVDKRGLGHWRAQSVCQMRESLAYRVEESWRERANLIIRPHVAYPVMFVQLDDVFPDQLVRVQDLAFLVIRTSPAGYQAWLAIDDCDSSFCQRVKKAVGADPGASGWVRVAGTGNFKRQYALDVPVVRLQTAKRGCMVTKTELHAGGLVAPPEFLSFSLSWGCGPASGVRPKAWPSYKRCLDAAPQTANGEKDRSLADFTFACISLRWGWSAKEIAAHLVGEPLSKASQRGPKYAGHTVERAAAVVVG